MVRRLEYFLKINDYFSFFTFWNLTAISELYLLVEDTKEFFADTEKFLNILIENIKNKLITAMLFYVIPQNKQF